MAAPLAEREAASSRRWIRRFGTTTSTEVIDEVVL
jgi:hypothetical protein